MTNLATARLILSANIATLGLAVLTIFLPEPWRQAAAVIIIVAVTISHLSTFYMLWCYEVEIQGLFKK